jgi:hypothetical protein
MAHHLVEIDGAIFAAEFGLDLEQPAQLFLDGERTQAQDIRPEGRFDGN